VAEQNGPPILRCSVYKYKRVDTIPSDFDHNLPFMTSKINKRLKWFLGLTGLAILTTVYLSYMHFRPTASTLCKINDYLDCDIVNKSIYSELFDIPVAILGMVTYVLLFILGWMVLRKIKLTHIWKALNPTNLLWFMFALTAIGVLFSAYLTYIELFVLHAICIFCMIQQVIIIVNFFLLLSILSTIDNKKT
jgi:uncharacterized membrane protein